MRCAIKLDSAFSAVSCSDREKDVVRLGAYTAVVYAQPAMLPFLGGGESEEYSLPCLPYSFVSRHVPHLSVE